MPQQVCKTLCAFVWLVIGLFIVLALGGWRDAARAAELEAAESARPARGNPNAPVTVVEFSDFQCPFCQQAYPVLKQLLAKYKDEVKLVYRDVPIRRIHPEAELAAAASRCAGEQGKFWEYHDALFEAAGDLKGPSLMSRAERLALDSEEFDACLRSGKFKDAIEADFQEAIRLGVTGTPAFFVNGTLVPGSQIAVLEQKIQEALEAVRTLNRETFAD